ncbi:hypothetical protein Taro_042189, partial [Colocasia esculenta]|nr:hypothetical protein [Colocasia esculenta]
MIYAYYLFNVMNSSNLIKCLIGTLKATLKFRVLRQHVLQALHNSPQPEPACFVIQCLYILPLLGPLYTEGFSHLLISSLHRLQTVDMVQIHTSDAKCLAAQLFLDILSCSVVHKERILLKLLDVFDIELKDIGKAIYGSDMDDVYLGMVKSKIGQYIVDFVESQSYFTAITLMEHFSICPSCQSGQSFLEKLIHENQFRAAEKWATLMGKQVICVLVQKYLDMKMLKQAYDIIKKSNLKQEFPDAYHLYKQSSLKKLAEKGCWDVAEIRAKNDQQLLEYLVYLAMEAGYSEKVDELCERYSLSGFIGVTAPEACPLESRYLHVKEFVLDDISWVDNMHGLRHAACYIQDCKVVGIDCEWKPNYVKGSKPNKVSIMQIASEKRVFIFDLIKLYEDERKGLDECFKSIFHSPKILKLGYNLQCDLHQLSHSYGDLECFRHYEMLLDIQKLFKEHRGGLSGLAKIILGSGLNKTRRNSNWEQRPLSQNQIEYAALDAAVLIHIFRHVHSQPHSADVKEKRSKTDWKSHIVSHVGDMRGCQSFAGSQNDVEDNVIVLELGGLDEIVMKAVAACSHLASPHERRRASTLLCVKASSSPPSHAC